MTTFYLGQYPQSEVKNDSPIYAKLISAQDWDEKNDIILDGIKYRRIKSCDANFRYHYIDYEEYQQKPRHYYWEDDETYHYFKYEPIKWIVLGSEHHDPKTMLLISDVILDCRSYHEKERNVTWYDSTIRSWLNGYGKKENMSGKDYKYKNFINDAFSKEEQDSMLTDKFCMDKIFLSWDIENVMEDYSILKNICRCQSSEYAKAMGVWTSISKQNGGNGQWWTNESRKSLKYKICVDCDGTTYGGVIIVDSKLMGVRPMINVVFTGEMEQWINKEMSIKPRINGDYELDELYDFYKGIRPNPDGLYINDIWKMNDEQLENNHKYIQWLFPLKQKSQGNPYAPVLSEKQAECISDIKQRGSNETVFMKSYRVMLKHYGFSDSIRFSDDFEEKSKVWLTPENHNFKRITRMMDSLSLMIYPYQLYIVEDFREILRQVYRQYPDIIGVSTAKYWKL